MKLFLLLIFLVSNFAYATPSTFEVWFLSIDKQTVYRQFAPTSNVSYRSIASNVGLQCQPMGEYCFDPQIGLYKKDKNVSAIDSTVDQSVVNNDETYDFIPTGDSVNRKMLDCSKNSKFDIFCGKTKGKKISENIQLELWLDTSTTMKQVDFKGFDKKCTRQIFLEKMNQSCPMNEKMKVYYFNQSRKEAGSFDRACISNGLNNMDRLLQDVKRVNKKRKLIIVTDIFEANADFISKIESMGGTIKGLDKPIYAKNLLSDFKRIKAFCK